MKSIDAIVLHEGNVRETRSCIGSLESQTARLGKIFVVNNCKTNLFSDAGVVALNPGKNIGAAAGRNLAARQSASEFLLFADSDAVLEKDCVERLRDAIKREKNIGAAVPLIFNYSTGKIWYSGGKISALTLKTSHSTECILADMRTEYAPSTVMLVKRSAFDYGKGFDERLFVYFEDTDFCLRLSKRSGIIVCSKAVAFHKFSESPEKAKRRAFFFPRNRIIIARKNFGFSRLFLFFAYLLTVDMAGNLFSFVSTGRPSLFLGHLRGIIDGVRQ